MKTKMGKTLKNILYGSIIVGTSLISSCKPEPKLDITPPKIEIYSPEKNQAYDTRNIEFNYNIEEENFRNASYSVDNGAKKPTPQSGIKNLTLPNGNHKIKVYAEDESGNSAKDSTYFNINYTEPPKPPKDTIAPEVDISSPLENKVYDSNVIPFSGSASDDEDANPSVSYTLNDGASVVLPSTWSKDLDLQNGNYRIIVKAKDKAGNSSADTTDFIVDKPVPPTWKYLVNPFIQPNQSDLNWYGSGDVDNDNKVDASDVSKMESIINGSFVPNLNSNDVGEYRTLDRADVNGDGVVDSSDKQILENKLNRNIDYLPGEWDKLESKEERENLHEQRHLFQWNNKLDTIPYVPGEFECREFASLNTRDFHGFPEMGYDKETEWRDNGRYNIPEYYIEFIRTDGGHAVTGAVTGEDIRNFEDWDIREINGLKYGKDIAFPENCKVVVNYTYVKENEVQGKFLSGTPIIKFKITNRTPSFEWINDDPNLKIITER